MTLIASHYKENKERVNSKITDVERQTLDLLCEGLCNKEIATKLSITEQTVKNRFKGIFIKYKVDSRLKLALAYYKEKLAKEKQDEKDKDNMFSGTVSINSIPCK